MHRHQAMVQAANRSTHYLLFTLLLTPHSSLLTLTIGLSSIPNNHSSNSNSFQKPIASHILKMQSTATKQRIKESDIKQATLQAISVIQTTIQCGIAQVCFSRNLFPASFFRQVEINATDNGSQNVDRIVVFDLDSDSAGSAMASLQTTSQLEEERKRGSGSKSESESGINHQSQEAETNLSLFSPLTCSFDETMSVHTHHMNSQLKGSREQRRNSDKSRCSGNDYLKAEIRLLLHWVQGLLDILHDNDGRNSLMRVIFGICKPGASNDGGIVGDKVLESFAVSYS
eukprot:scaffold7259_cov267-Chaetoceros_neogracile.AAC.11